jgi:exodeoxyribonuclease VII large subunit
LNSDSHTSTLSRQIYSVQKLIEKIKLLLEKNFPMVWICGEISNLRIPSSGHAYFTLKDEKAQIAAVMFRGQLRQLQFELENGLTIIGLGRISVYEPRGTFQIILEYVEPKGAGALQLAFEQLKQKLAREGLFDASAKAPLPFLPQTIAVITSPTGAAIRDILHVLQRRFPNVRIEIVPVAVQGDAAAKEITRALSVVNLRAAADVIILARGGGSLEDLAAFNTESVARAIFASSIPVISAVGHETDFTIADFVADVRAPTPSAAAELVVPVKVELRQRCLLLQQRCFRVMANCVARKKDKFAQLRRALVHPIKKIQEKQLRTDDLTQRLHRAARSLMQGCRADNRQVRQRLLRCDYIRQIDRGKQKVAFLNFKLFKTMENCINQNKKKIGALQASLAALNPQAVLERGYSITRTIEDQHVVIDSNMIDVNEDLEVLLAKGRLHVKVVKSNG